jgi:hypothetical protein
MSSENGTTSTESNAEGSYGDIPENSVSFLEMDTEDDDKGQKKVGRGVCFKSESALQVVRRISRSSGYDFDEIMKYWGDDDEECERKTELKKAVKDMYNHRRMSDNDFTTLGIEDKAGHGRAVRKVNKMISRNAVMDEQNLQYHEGVLDDELLADVYSITSAAAKREAKAKAERLHDALVEE